MNNHHHQFDQNGQKFDQNHHQFDQNGQKFDQNHHQFDQNRQNIDQNHLHQHSDCELKKLLHALPSKHK